MQAIHTKYIPATSSRGARIKAYTSSNKAGVIVPVDYALDGEQRHFKAAKAFIAKHFKYAPDSAAMCYGDSADGKGYVFCFTQSTITEL